MPTVALTGGTGFIGAHLLPRLIGAGWTVRLLARRPPAHPLWHGLAYDVVPGGLDDARALADLVAGADALVHAAGVVRARDPGRFFAVNADAAGAIAWAARAAGVRRSVLVSSMAARLPALSAYAASKAAAEAAFAEAAPEAWIALRPTAVYGPWDRASLAIFRAARGSVVPVVAGTVASLIHVHDVADAIVAALGTDQAGTVELDDGSAGYTWPRVMSAAAGRPVRCVAVPRAAFVLAGHGAALARLAGRAPFFTADKARELVHPDWRRTGPALERWGPSIGLDQGFAATAAWYRARGWL